VSLSWRERILIALEPQAVHAVRLKDGEKRSGAWPEGLAQVLAGWPSAEVSVVASNRLVRYVVVPRTAGVSGEAEELALARHHFIRVHGERSRDWDVRYSRETGLASAVDKGLLDELRESLKPHRLVSLQPYLMAAFNRLRARVPKEGAWIVLPEAEATCVALYANGGWAGVAVNRAGSDESLERERMRMGSARAPRTVLTPPGNDGYAIAALAQ
jgi:hypothetical protein